MEMSHMQRSKLESGKFSLVNFSQFGAVALLLAGCIPAPSFAQGQGQKTFSTVEEARKALLTATQKNDEKMMVEILGRDAKLIVYSGDDEEDAAGRATFVQKYDQMHRFMKEPDGTTTLYIGAENWPTPIPLVHKGSVWYFDGEMAKKEILY